MTTSNREQLVKDLLLNTASHAPNTDGLAQRAAARGRVLRRRRRRVVVATSICAVAAVAIGGALVPRLVQGESRPSEDAASPVMPSPTGPPPAGLQGKWFMGGSFHPDGHEGGLGFVTITSSSRIEVDVAGCGSFDGIVAVDKDRINVGFDRPLPTCTSSAVDGLPHPPGPEDIAAVFESSPTFTAGPEFLELVTATGTESLFRSRTTELPLAASPEQPVDGATVPDVLGLDQEDAMGRILTLGAAVSITSVRSAPKGTPEGAVVATLPAVGEAVTSGQPVHLVVYSKLGYVPLA